MKTKMIFTFAFVLCVACGLLFWLDLGQEPPAETEQPAKLERSAEKVAHVVQVTQVPGLPDAKWIDGEPGADDEAVSFDLEAAYYYNDTDYLLCGVSSTPAGWQGKIFRMADGAEPELLGVWPEDSLYGHDDYLSSYYLPASQTLVLYNQRQHTFLVYDNTTGQAEEFAAPAEAELKVDDQSFWLGDGRYLLTRFEQDAKELQRVTRFVNLYDEKNGTEVRLAHMATVWSLLMPPTAQEPNRWLLLGCDSGDLLELTLEDSGEVKVQQRCAYTRWLPKVPWLYYNGVQPVQNAAGDYAVLRVGCEDGTHYQIVNLNSDKLGECMSEDNKGGGLLAAYGDTVYFSEHFAGDSPDACRIIAYNYLDNTSEIIFGTETDGLTENYPGLWNFNHGAISPDGRHLVLLADDYVVKLRLAAETD